MQLEQIKEVYKEHIGLVETYVQDQGRRELIKSIIETFGEEYVISPASSKGWYHNAFPGGYVDHVNRVVKTSFKVKELYNSIEGEVDFSDEELFISGLFHDLGKLGYPKKPQYISQDNKWRRDNLDELYKINTQLEFMKVPDRSLYVLQLFGFKLSKNEYLGIKLHDGIFEDSNKAYFISNREESRMRTNLVNILHTADYLASKAEYDIYSKNR